MQTAVRSELATILAAPSFAQSARCKRFLTHVVLQSLQGNASQLKERTIGIHVFDRAYDYNTGEDSIVRVTANEVRKRIGQFYQESRAAHPVQIELPRGAYVPEFIIHPVTGNGHAEESVSMDPVHETAPASEHMPMPKPPSDSSLPTIVPDSETVRDAIEEKRGKAAAHKLVLSFVAVAVALGIGVALFAAWSHARSKAPTLWSGFLHTNLPVLICLGTHNIPDTNVPPSEARDFSDVVLHKNMIPIDDATVITSMAKLLGEKGIAFRLAGAGQTSFTDLQRQPVILIGAVDNQWTLRLTQTLPYRIEVTEPPSPGGQPAVSIVDASQPGSGPWKIDFSIPMSAWKNDYAIVARENDATIGVPLLIEGGLGSDGSLAASEIVTSGALTERLGDERACRGKSNFEAVIGTEIIDTRPGPPHILRLICW